MNILERKTFVNGVFVLALVILSVIGWLSYKTMTLMIESEQWERHSLEEINRLVAKGHDHNSTILQEREIEDIAKTEKAIRLLVTGSVLSLALLCTVFILLKRELSRRSRSEEELCRHRDHLDRLVRERTTELEQAKSEAELSSRAKSEFLENMSHEMRTPLTGIMGVIDLMLTERLTDDHRHNMEMAQSSAEALKSLINDILDFSKISTGLMSFESEPFDLGSCVHSVTDSFDIQARHKGVSFKLEIDNQLPLQLVGDKKRVSQVLENLLRNAIKFTAVGEICVSIRLEHDPALPGQNVLHVSVRDTGTGIHAEYLERIFELFTQADTSSTKKFGGIGLGLALSKQIVEKMGGNIWGQSHVGVGSTFSFTIPLRVIDTGSSASE